MPAMAESLAACEATAKPGGAYSHHPPKADFYNSLNARSAFLLSSGRNSIKGPIGLTQKGVSLTRKQHLFLAFESSRGGFLGSTLGSGVRKPGRRGGGGVKCRAEGRGAGYDLSLDPVPRKNPGSSPVDHPPQRHTAKQAHSTGATAERRFERQHIKVDVLGLDDDDDDDIADDDDEEDDDEYFDEDGEGQGGAFDDDDLFDAENGAEESSLGMDEEATASTSSRRLPRRQAVGFEKRRTKRNYEPDQDDEDFFAEPWTEEDQILHRKYIVNFGRFTSEKWLPLHTAAACGQVSNIRYLVQQGVDIDGLDRDGFTPLHKAVMNVRDSAVRQLLRLGAKALLVDQDGASLLHYACQAGNITICKLLIRAKVPINQKDNDGWTPLHVAAQSGSRSTIRTLLMNGADPKARNRDNLTPYDLLKAYGQGFGFAPAKKLLAKPPNRRDLLTGRVR